MSELPKELRERVEKLADDICRTDEQRMNFMAGARESYMELEPILRECADGKKEIEKLDLHNKHESMYDLCRALTKLQSLLGESK